MRTYRLVESWRDLLFLMFHLGVVFSAVMMGLTLRNFSASLIFLLLIGIFIEVFMVWFIINSKEYRN